MVEGREESDNRGTKLIGRWSPVRGYVVVVVFWLVWHNYYCTTLCCTVFQSRSSSAIGAAWRRVYRGNEVPVTAGPALPSLSHNRFEV